MTIVLDTNVLIAAFIARGTCSELLEYCVVHHEVVLSAAILDELCEVLTRKFRFLPEEARQVARLLKSRVRIVDPKPLTTPLCRDPDDDRILAAALSAQCRAIITGDKDLTDLRQVDGIVIMTPSEFWKFEAEARTSHP
ncbi:MAG: putative toxin-antitoxin system toxin component, PIN family [bacterium]